MDEKITQFLLGFDLARADTAEGRKERLFDPPPSAEFRDGYDSWQRQIFERPVEQCH